MTIPLEPCAKPDHDRGYSFVRRPTTDDPKERVLFFGCLDCAHESFSQRYPHCPPSHRPYRYQSGCHACNT